MAKENNLTINDWQLGIGESPYTGFAQMANVDIYSKPGSLKISNILKRDGNSASVVDELIKWVVQDPNNGTVYAVDRVGKLYKRTTAGVWSVITGHGTNNAHGDGLAIWNDYLFYSRTTKLDVYALPSSPNGDAGTWYNDWQTLQNSSFYYLHPMLSSYQRFVLYIGNGHFVDTLEQNAGQIFDPADVLTYTYNSEDLELGAEYRVTCLEELGSDLAIGTLIGINDTINIADMFFWDGASDFVRGGATIRFAENGVQMTKNVNNTLYTIAGDGTPRIFNSVTSQAVEVKRFNNIDIPFVSDLTLFPAAIELKEGEVLFGIGHDGGSVDIHPMGVYALRNGAYVLRYSISTNNDGSENTLLIGAVKSVSSTRILVSWQDVENSTEFGVDRLDRNFYTSYRAFVESPFYTVGTEADPKTFELVEVEMGRKLQTGDGVRLKARYSLDDTWTTIATFDTPTYASRSTFKTKVSNLSQFKDVQFRVELTTSSTSLISPELKQITFK